MNDGPTSIRLVEEGDAEALAAHLARDADAFERWEPFRPAEFFTVTFRSVTSEASWTPILMVVGVFLIGQVLEGYVLSPKLVGPKVGLHPVWMMFALLAAAYLFGFVGLLVAIPLAATVGVLLRFALRKYLESPIYTGRDLEPR